MADVVEAAEVAVRHVADLDRQVGELPLDPVHLGRELLHARDEPWRLEAELVVQPNRPSDLALVLLERLPGGLELLGDPFRPPLLAPDLGKGEGALEPLLGRVEGVLRRGRLVDRLSLPFAEARGVPHASIVQRSPRGVYRAAGRTRRPSGSFGRARYDDLVRALVLGANGQLGSDILRLWTGRVEVIPATRKDADVTDCEAVRALVLAHRPDVVLNTTAFHNLPLCEQDPLRTFQVNAVGGWNVARAAREAGAALVQFSTDYVFDGTKGAPYVERDARRALNVYGASKIATEDLVLQAHPGALVVRVSGLFGVAGSAGKGGNFVETMLRLAREGQPIRVVADQVTAPTNTAEIAEGLLPLVEAGLSGVVHLAAAEGCSWADFAEAIFALCGLRPDFQRVTTEEFGGPVVRPRYSVLASERVPPLRHWRLGLERYLREKGHLPG